MPTFYGAVDLIKNELRNAVVQNLGSAPASPLPGQLYYDTTSNTLFWWNGTAWQSAKSLALSSTVTTAAIGDAPVVGVANTASAGDHKHGMPAFSTTVIAETTYGLGSGVGSAATLPHGDHTHGTPALTANAPVIQAISDVATVGVSTFPARDDHRHGMPAFGAPTAQAAFGLATATGSAVTVPHSDHAHGTPALPAVNALATTSGALNMNSFQINALADPTNPQDAATKNYVDNAIAGLSWKEAARAATTVNITLSGTQTVDGIALNVGDRVLVKNQATASANGLYLVAAAAWTRTTDATTGAQLAGMAVFIEQGTTNGTTSWTLSTPPPITVGTTNLTYSQFGANSTYTAGNGLQLTGNVFSALNADTSITVTAGGIAVNTAVIATQAYVNTAVTGVTKKYATTLAGTASPETITHNLNTRDIEVAVINGNSPYGTVQVDWQAVTVNTVSIIYNPALGAGYRVVVIG
jgi:hypothetical protein